MSDTVSFLLLKFGIDFYVSGVFLRERDKFEFFLKFLIIFGISIPTGDPLQKFDF